MFPTEFRVNWPFGSGVDEKKIFQRGGRLGLSIRTILAIFDLRHPDDSYQVSSRLAFRFTRGSEKIDFQDCRHGGQLGFPIGTILTFFFYLQVTPMLPTKFQVYRPFGSRGEAKNRFSRWAS